MTNPSEKKEETKTEPTKQPNTTPQATSVYIGHEKSEKKENCIEEEANCFSRLLFLWTNKIIARGNDRYMTADDLFDVKKEDKYDYAWDQFTKSKAYLMSKNKFTVIKTIYRMNKLRLIAGLCFNLIGNLLQFAGPYLLKGIVNYISDSSYEEWEGYVFAAGLFVAYFLRAIFMQHGFHQLNTVAFRSTAACQALVLNKILSMKSTARGYLNTGKIVNTATIDAFSVYGFFQLATFIISAPVTMMVSIALIVVEVGPVGLVGIAVIIFGTHVSSKISTRYSKNRRQKLSQSDKRSKALDEYISGIRIVKYYGWEKYVVAKIDKIRWIETKLLLVGTIWKSILEMFVNLIPVIINLAVFGLYVAVGNDLTPSKAYATLALFNILQGPVRMISFVIISLSSTKVSLRRLQHFDGWENWERPRPENSGLPAGSMSIENATFTWDTETAKKHWQVYLDNFEKKKAPPKKKAVEAKKGAEEKKAGDDKKAGEEKKGGDDKKAGPPNGASPEGGPKGPHGAHGGHGHHGPHGPHGGPKGPMGAPGILAKETKVKEILHDIDLQVKPGEFIGIIGEVGAGKSSLLNALMGEMNHVKGNVKFNGKIAYVPQSAWLMNNSLKNNVLFGSEYDEDFYNYVLDICELRPDIAILQGKDETEIGEKGINLSGGQKQRVSIARAVYYDADIYLIDDALSALDAHVGRQIYENVIREQLKGKTIIFVTHALQYIHECDRVIVMKDGRIHECGTVPELRAKPDSEFNRINMNEDKKTDDKESPEAKAQGKATITQRKKRPPTQADPNAKPTPLDAEKTKQAADLKKKGTLSSVETKASGAISWKVYKYYLSAGGCCNIIFIMFLYFCSIGFKMANDWWVGAWSEDEFDLESEAYVGYYAVIGVITTIAIFIRALLFGLFTRKTSIVLQKALVRSIFRSPMSWFDTTPKGRILNRASKDQDDVDTVLPWSFQTALQNVFTLVSTLILIGTIMPLFFAPSFIIAIFFTFVAKKYMRASRELKRIQSIARSPTITTISECASGYHVIRAFNLEDFYRKQLEKRFNHWITASGNTLATGRWISLRTDVYASLIIFSAGIFAVLSREFNYNSNPVLIGLALTYALQITTFISFTVKVLAETELQMNAVERIMEYINKKEIEAEWESKEKLEDWPEGGKFEIQNVSYQYMPDKPIVIDDISFSVAKGEKIGVVGRTGAGKSTLTLGILRILEILEREGKKGRINLDNKNVATLGLHDLRKKVTMIPQDPVLFSGSVRDNVDPFHEFSDAQVIDALKKVNIWHKIDAGDQVDKEENPFEKVKKIKSEKKNVEDMTDAEKDIAKLNMRISDGGGNFSLGQRQLICMARAIVRKNKVLVMDEATASIDEMTDRLLQKMIKEEFKNTTVITIAHRINTIIQYDKILAMKDGKVAEFDTPLNLMNKPDGLFASMIDELGEEQKAKLVYLATHKDVDTDALKEEEPIIAINGANPKKLKELTSKEYDDEADNMDGVDDDADEQGTKLTKLNDHHDQYKESPMKSKNQENGNEDPNNRA